MKAAEANIAKWLPRSLAARGALVISCAVASIVLPGCWAYRSIWDATRQTQAASSEAFLATAVTQHLKLLPPEENSVGRAWTENLAPQRERVRWAGVFDDQRQGVEFIRLTELPTAEIMAQIPFGATEPVAAPLMIADRQSRRYRLLTFPLPEGRTLAAVIDFDGVDIGRAAAVATMAACTACIGLVLTGLLYQRAILAPVNASVSSLMAIAQDLTYGRAGLDLPQEFDALARSVEETRKELMQWRTRATHLKNAFDAQVDSKTRDVELALHQAERRADTDKLTGLHNRNYFDREMPRVFHRCRTEMRSLSVIVFDVNNFKTYNDTHGHQAGDDVLAAVGDLIRQCARKGQDIGVRYGGDEFLLVLPDRNASDALDVARRLVAFFRQRAMTFEKTNPPVGLSAGVAELQGDGPSHYEQLLQFADHAMYQAKRSRTPAASYGQLTDAARTGRRSAT